jgi:hypothetical protein
MTIRGSIIRFLKYLKELKTWTKMLILFLIISFIIIGGQFLILTRIYYKTSYEGDLQNLDFLIEKAESFDYIRFVKDQGQDQGYNLTKNSGTYIDRDYIEYLKEKIDRDTRKFHWWPFHAHYFHYTFNLTVESQIFFTYTNNSVIGGQYNDSRLIFSAYMYIDLIWEGNSFINFSQVPYVDNNSINYNPFYQSSTISLNNTILIKMELYYRYVETAFGHKTCRTEQFIALNSKYQFIFIFISSRSGCFQTI